MIKTEEERARANDFYREAISILNESGHQFLVGGAFALRTYTEIARETKDLDLFCKPGDYPKILKTLHQKGFNTEITDARWIAKAFKDNLLVDFIFSTVNNLCQVDETWFNYAREGELFGQPVKYIAPEDLFWCKIYIQDRYHYDGADVNHIILKKGHEMDWHRIMMRLDQHWHLVLAQFLNFQFIYPADRDMVPKWLFDELLERAKDQYDLPAPIDKVCRGPLIDHTQYNTDITEWEYKIITCKKL